LSANPVLPKPPRLARKVGCLQFLAVSFLQFLFLQFLFADAEFEGRKCLHRNSVNFVLSVVDFQRTAVDAPEGRKLQTETSDGNFRHPTFLEKLAAWRIFDC
jgi:hypothetical protein